MTGKPDHTLVLSGDAGIKCAAEVAASLKTALQDHARIDIDTQTVAAADLTTVQTILAARTSALAQGKTVSMAAPIGAPLGDVLRSIGFLSPGQPESGFWANLSAQPEDALP